MPDRLQTERLRLRPMTPGDIGRIAALNADDVVMRHITGRASSVDESASELESSLGTRWLLFRCVDDRFLGWVGAVPTGVSEEFEIGWRLRRSAWGRGFATEAARALITQLFVDGAQRIVAESMAVNARSRAVMERIGLSYVRTCHLEFDDPLPGTDQGEVEYELTRAEWERHAHP